MSNSAFRQGDRPEPSFAQNSDDLVFPEVSIWVEIFPSTEI